MWSVSHRAVELELPSLLLGQLEELDQHRAVSVKVRMGMSGLMSWGSKPETEDQHAVSSSVMSTFEVEVVMMVVRTV